MLNATVSLKNYKKVQKECQTHEFYFNKVMSDMRIVNMQLEQSNITMGNKKEEININNIAEMAQKIVSLQTSQDALLKEYSDVFYKNLMLTKELETWKTPCPVDGLPVADCHGFDCSICAINDQK